MEFCREKTEVGGGWRVFGEVVVGSFTDFEGAPRSPCDFSTSEESKYSGDGGEYDGDTGGGGESAPGYEKDSGRGEVAGGGGLERSTGLELHTLKPVGEAERG